MSIIRSFLLVLVLILFLCTGSYASLSPTIMKTTYRVEKLKTTALSNHIANLHVRVYIENYTTSPIQLASASGTMYFISTGYASPSTPPHKYSTKCLKLNQLLPPNSSVWIPYKDFSIINYAPGEVVIPIIRSSRIPNDGLVSANSYFLTTSLGDANSNTQFYSSELVDLPRLLQ